jgi:site-specific recombinase XerD
MLGAGEQLKTIRDVLGHRSIESTFIYTKVDVGMLRYAALDWPVSP